MRNVLIAASLLLASSSAFAACSIEVDGNRATVRCYTSEIYDQEGLTKRDRGVYEDACVKVNGKWHFASRTFRNIHRQHAPKGC